MTATVTGQSTRIGFLLLPSYSLIAFANAVEVLRMANRLAGLESPHHPPAAHAGRRSAAAPPAPRRLHPRPGS